MNAYNITITRVYDGDTVTADIDLGFGVVLREQHIRLIGLDTPEVRGDSREDGLRVRDAVREKLASGRGKMLPEPGCKKCKYGRWLGTIFTEDGEDINKWLLETGNAKPM